MMSLLLVDNYDSFTFNLVQAFRSRGAEVEVVRNDHLTADELLDRCPAAIVLSPGPGRPEDAGVCLELVRRRPPIPLLGVCLGHQVLAHADGGSVVSAPEPCHGKTSWVEHDDQGIFAGLSRPFAAMRYHSLMVDVATLPAWWRPVAESEDGVLMAMRHRDLPWWGVQFHPESVLCREGPRLMGNFLALVAEASG